jgi:hypothetical protein
MIEPDAGAETGAVDLYFAAQLDGANRRTQRLAELVQQDESAIGIDVHLVGHPQRRDHFDAVHKQGGHCKIDTD